MIRFNDRVVLLGSTGCGKSELANRLFTDLHGGAQRVVLDTKHEFAVPGVEPVSDVAAIDWTQPIIHYRDGGGGVGEMQDFFAACHARRRIVVLVHELSDVCDFSAGRTPPAFNEYVSKGRALGQGLIAGSQRPFEVPSRAKSEADHVFLFVPRFGLEQDHKAAAQTIGMNVNELAATLDELLATLGEHSFLHFDRRERSVVACEPLSEAERSGIVVTRPELF